MIKELIHPVSFDTEFPARLAELAPDTDRSAAVGRYLTQ